MSSLATLTNLWKDDYLLVDSGASCNVCPMTYKAELPLQPLTGSAPMLRAVTGALLKIHGTSLVNYTLERRVKLEARYFVADVKFPVLSVGSRTSSGSGSACRSQAQPWARTEFLATFIRLASISTFEVLASWTTRWRQ